MDNLVYSYSQKIRTLQTAIKTQNEIMINKISQTINQSTLEALEKLDENLKNFLLNIEKIKEIEAKLKNKSDQKMMNYNLEWINIKMGEYEQNNLRNILNQISASIRSLTGNQTFDQVSSLQDALILFFKSTDLYSKNITELLNFRQPPNISSPTQFIQHLLNGVGISLDSRSAQLKTQINELQLNQETQIDCALVYDIHPIKNTTFFLVVTYDNDILIFCTKKQKIIRYLDPLRFAPASVLFLHGPSTQIYDGDCEINQSNILLLGGSEFDPSVYVYNFNTGKRIQTLPGHQRSVRYLQQLGDFNTFLSAGRESLIFFWDMAKAEPIHIQNLATLEIIDLQIHPLSDEIYCLSIDGKILVLQIGYKQIESGDSFKFSSKRFEKVTVKQIIESGLTSSLSQLLWINSSLVVVSYSSGWLTGINQIKVLQEKLHITTLQFNNDFKYELDDEIQQLVSLAIMNKLFIFVVKKKTGLIEGFVYPDHKQINIVGQIAVYKQEDQGKVFQQIHLEQVRWNIKIVKLDKICILKYGQQDIYQIFDIQY